MEHRFLRPIFDHLNINLPYDLDPGYSTSGHRNVIASENDWAVYRWNPPHLVRHVDEYSQPDPNASPKPTWAELVAAGTIVEFNYTRDDMLLTIDSQATRRIAIIYDSYAEFDRNKEWETRLSGQSVDIEDVERVRLTSIANNLKSQINAAATLADLQAIDIESDSVWGTSYNHNNYFGFIGTTDSPASVTGTNTEPFLLTSETSQVRINDYSVYITRDPALPAQTAVDDINNNYRDITASVDNGAIKIESDFTGPGSELNIQDASWPAYTALGITPQLYRGSRTVGTLNMSTDVHITRFLLTKGTWTVEHIPATGKYCLFFLIHPDSEPISKIHDGSFDITDVFDMQTYTHNGADYRYYIMDPKHAVGSDYNNTILEITI